MEMEHGKLFIGGISWDTNEELLREYFESYGEVVEAVIMKDHATGRARGFGFVVFSDPAVADKAVKEKHVIDGRTVEAKKAVPRDAQNVLTRNNSSTHSSPGPVRTKKIFVGGLASTITENEFKSYFEQFGMIIDVVVMYDHNTQRPRGFGFITYESEESVDNVLLKTFHDLNGKMVEVKRAVPKELSPGPTRSPYALSRGSGLDLNPNSIGNYGVRMDGRFSPLSGGRSGYPPFSPFGYGFGSNIGIGRGYSNRYNNPLNNPSRNEWGSETLGYSNLQNTNNRINFGGGNIDRFSAFENTGGIWGSTGSLQSNNIRYRGGENSFVSGVGFNRKSVNSIGRSSSYGARNGFHENTFGDLYGGDSLYGSFTLGLGSSTSDITPNNSVGYVGYSVNNSENRGIAT